MNDENICNVASTDPRTKRSRHEQKAKKRECKKKKIILKHRKIRG